MNILEILAWVVLGLSGVCVIAFVLMQQGKGADMGAAFGSGASGSLFGATGSASVLSRATSVSAILFFIACLGLAIIAKKEDNLGLLSGSASTQEQAKPTQAAPKVPAKPVVPN